MYVYPVYGADRVATQAMMMVAANQNSASERGNNIKYGSNIILESYYHQKSIFLKS
jgi:hypothetical protein